MRFPTKLLLIDNETLQCGENVYHANLKASTKATYSLSNRAFFFEGNVETGIKNGDYAIRNLNGADGGTLLCMGVHDEPHYAGYDYCFFARCNTLGALARKTDGVWKRYVEDLLVYKVTTTRSDKAQNDGLLDQTIYVCYLPASVGAKKDDIMTFEDTALDDPYNGQQYRVDSVDDGLTLFGDVQNGTVCIQLSFYSKEAEIETGDEPMPPDEDGFGNLE